MGAKVSNFVADVGKAIAKGATSFVGTLIPVVGTPLANAVNNLYKKGGKVVKPFADGGIVPDGFAAKPINTAAQLVSLVKKFPEEASKAGLSVDEIKEAAKEVATKKRGGRAKKPKKEVESESDEEEIMVDVMPHHAMGGVHRPLDPLNHLGDSHNHLHGPMKRHHVYGHPHNSVF